MNGPRRPLALMATVVASLGAVACQASSKSSASTAPTTTAASSGPTSTSPSTDPSENVTDVDAVVNLVDLSFSPGRVTIRVGHQVTWHWTGSIPHNVTFRSFASDTQTEGEFKHTFNRTGTFSYNCTLHTEQGVGMTGTVVVIGS